MPKYGELDGAHIKCVICVTLLGTFDHAGGVGDSNLPAQAGDIQGHLVSFFVTISSMDRLFCDRPFGFFHLPALAL